MSWSKIIACYFVIAQMVLAPVISHAATPGLEVENGQLTEAGKEKVSSLQQYAGQMRYDSRVDLKNNKMFLVSRETKKVVGVVVLRDEKSLMEYSPLAIKNKLGVQWTNLKLNHKQSIEHTWKSFPVESVAFFLALGGMTAMQLMTNYADNPVGMKQHIEHSLSPAGQLGFFMFMYSQGITANALNMWLKRPSLGMPIGMVGMSVGMTVNNYFNQVVHDPHISACVDYFYKGQKDESTAKPCEGVFKYLVKDKKILEGPGIASMLGAFLVVTGARFAAGAVLRIIGVELATLLIPGGIEIKGARWVLALASSSINAAAFTVVQLKIEHYISYAWKNYFDGKEFVDFNDKIVADIEGQKRSQWNGKSDEFNARLRDFSKKMSAWRVNNLSEAYMAHQNWSEFLGQLTSRYATSYNFYDTYVKELTAKDSLIDVTYPLNGVTAKNMADGHDDLFFTRPDFVEGMQKETAKDVAAFIATNLQNGYYKKLGFIKFQTDIMTKIQAGLASENSSIQGKAILELNDARRKYAQNVVGSMEFSRELFQIAAKLGRPEPMFEKGRGYAAAMMKSPNTMEAYKEANLDNYNGLFKTPTVADYFIVQMMCGPDTSKNEKVISITKGFPAKFNAPTITLDDEAKETLCYGTATTQLGAERIYNLPVGNYRTAPEFLRGNINPEVAQDFNKWWETHTESELKAAFRSFGKSYKGIVEKLFKGLNETKNSSWNRGLISNGAMVASFQEARLYSLILGELLKDSYKAQKKTTVPSDYLTTEVDPKVAMNARYYEMSKKPLLGLLSYAPRFDFNTLTSTQPNADVRSLKIQKDLEGEFAKLNGLVQKARTQSVKSDEYQNQLKAIEAKLSEFSTLLGVKKTETADDSGMPSMPEFDSSTTSGAALVTLNPEQKALAVTCLELLQALSQELSMYGNMAGTARYPDSK